jgi:hypothetical protein
MTKKESPDTLPTVLPDSIPFPVVPLPAGTSLEHAQSVDAQAVAATFQNIAAMWSQARDVDTVCKMALITFKALKERRDLLGLPRDYQAPRERKEYVVYPID